MKKYIWKMVLIMGIIFILTIKYVDVSFGGDEVDKFVPENTLSKDYLEMAWTKLQVPVNQTSISIDGWAKINELRMKKDELEAIALEVGKKLGIRWEKNPPLTKDEGEFAYWNQQGMMDSWYATLIVQSLVKDNRGETHVGITVLGDYAQGKLSMLVKKIEDVLKGMGEANISIAIQGRIKKALALDVKADLVKKVTQTLSGRMISNSDVEGCVGYSPFIKNEIIFSGEKINWQLICRESLDADETEVILATPLYLQEY